MHAASLIWFTGLNFCKDHRDKIEVPDPLGVEDLISYKLNNRRTWERLVKQYGIIFSNISEGAAFDSFVRLLQRMTPVKRNKLGSSDSVTYQANLFHRGQISGWTKCLHLNSSFIQLDMPGVFTSTYGGRGMPRVVTTSLGISAARWGGLYSEVCFKSSYKSLTIRTDKNLRMWNSSPSSVSNVSTPGT